GTYGSINCLSPYHRRPTFPDMSGAVGCALSMIGVLTARVQWDSTLAAQTPIIACGGGRRYRARPIFTERSGALGVARRSWRTAALDRPRTGHDRGSGRRIALVELGLPGKQAFKCINRNLTRERRVRRPAFLTGQIAVATVGT